MITSQKTNLKHKAIKYRLYPTEDQEVFFAKSFGCCRKIWNLMLSDRIESYKATGKSVKKTPAQYKEKYPYLKEVDSLALANVYMDLERAYQNFFNKRSKFPKLKSLKRARKAYTTNNQKGSIAILDDKIKLPKVGLVKAKIHREAPDDWVIKSATISKSSDNKYYASVLFEFEEKAVVPSVFDTVLGLDYKSDGLYMDSNGNIGTNHKYYRESQKKLTKEQRRLSRKKGSKKNETKSNNYLKQQEKVNRIHKHVANQRLDNLHKLSNEIANHYDVVCVESLNMKDLSNKGFKNGKATMDNGYGMFLNMLEYKLKDRGKHFVKVDKFYPSSQICSKCGARHKLSLDERTYGCSCGNVMNRDLNAAINIKREGLRLLLDKAAA